MNFKPLLFKKGFLCITALETLLILTISVKSRGQGMDSDHPSRNRQPTLYGDSRLLGAIFPIELPRMTGVDAISIFWLGLGHHDNPTEARSWTGPKLKTSSTSWIIHIEFGGGTKRVFLSYFLSARAPLPLTAVFNGYKHRGGLIEHGPLLRWTALSMKSRLNFTPITGYRWLTETARIYDVQRLKPDSLNFKYRDHGLLFGLDCQVTLWKIREISDHRLAFGYLHEKFRNHREKADKYRIEYRFYDFFRERGTTDKIEHKGWSYFSLGLEHVRWPGDRSDWFLIGSFSLEGR